MDNMLAIITIMVDRVALHMTAKHRAVILVILSLINLLPDRDSCSCAAAFGVFLNTPVTEELHN